MTLRLSNFDTSQPEMGKPTIFPNGITKSRLPNSASLRSYNSFTEGILDAQVANEIPLIKKQILNAMRCLCLASILDHKLPKGKCVRYVLEINFMSRQASKYAISIIE